MRRLLAGAITGLVVLTGSVIASKDLACVKPIICVEVPVPGPTVTLPGATVTLPAPPPRTVTIAPEPAKTVMVPGPTKTIPVTVTKTVAVPGPTSTIIQPRPISTAQPRSITPSGQTTTQRVTIGPEQTKPAPVPTVTKTVEVPGEETVRFTTEEAAGISAVLLILGSLLFLAIMYVMYIIGHREGADSDRGFLRELRDLVRKR